MKLIQFLNEETYNLDKVAGDIFKNIVVSFYKTIRKHTKKVGYYKAPEISATYPIKKYLPENIFKDIDVKMTVYFTRNHSDSPRAESYPAKRTIKIVFPIVNALIGFEDEKIKKELFGYLHHEIAHIFDIARSNFKTHAKYTTEKAKKKPMSLPYKYFTDPMEINAYIHQIKEFKRDNLKKWDKVKNIESLVRTFFGNNFYSTALFDKQKRLNFNRKLLKRLARENMLPKAMQ